MFFFSDGSWFWTSIMTGQVAGFDADGTLIEAAQLTPGVNPITFSNDGRLFVSQCFFGTNLYEVDPLGKAEARLISDELGPGCGLNGMDWGPDNRLYGPRWHARKEKPSKERSPIPYRRNLASPYYFFRGRRWWATW